MTAITNGSKKQIAWAEDIRARWIASFDEIIADYSKMANGNQAALDKFAAIREIVISNLSASADAKHYIDLEVSGYRPDYKQLMRDAIAQYQA